MRMRELTMTVSTKSRFRSSIAASALILSLVVSPPIAGAASPAVDPTVMIADLGTQGIQSLGQAATSAERIARLGTLFRQDFDINGIGVFALGTYRRVATPAEQQEFFRLYPEFTVRAFQARLNNYQGAPFRVTGQMVYRGGCGSRLDDECASPSVTMIGSRSAWPWASRKERSDVAFRRS